MGANPSDSPTSDGSPELRTPEDYNQVEVQTTSGELHCVEYVLRHPNHEWVYASKVTEVSDDGIHSNDLVLRAAEIESFESEQISTKSPEEGCEGRPVDTYSEQSIWIHHTVPYGYVSTDDAWKAWPSDEEVSRFQPPEN